MKTNPERINFYPYYLWVGVFFIANMVNAQDIYFIKDMDTINAYTISSYKKGNEELIVDKINFRKFEELLNKSDSTFINYSFYKEQLFTKNLIDNLYYTRAQLSLDTLKLTTSKEKKN
ncbi:hypothetical protein BST92_14125 [Nonlabens arenilitoris]|uniref:Uncharacterized protein n=2 Tax=Nonlabens arenilitoris TaxID=1217969 RepID=A0A2S7UDH4_9FLAO|nr:hypothetical protein BST92_14125 [Nonlabens arenilitoris]